MNIVEFLKDNHPHLLEQLVLMDKAMDGILIGDPTHTMSYNIAKAAAGGDPQAQWFCGKLNALSPNHCAEALAHESDHVWRPA